VDLIHGQWLLNEPSNNNRLALIVPSHEKYTTRIVLHYDMLAADAEPLTTSCLVPSLDDANGTGENDGMLLVCVFAYDQIDVLRVHLIWQWHPITSTKQQCHLSAWADTPNGQDSFRV